MKNSITFFILASLLTGCASMKESLLTGAGAGLVLGAAMGNAQGKGDSRNRSTNNGAIIGALLGAGIGYLGHKSKLKELEKKGLNAHKTENDVPLLTQPKIKRIWVDDKVQGKRFIKGHWEYTIEEQSVWSK
ncbi:MAG: hypothetical protein KDD45_06160 [Bdellovibrionales bacterium]|nr:hypothetical protein [Bdellovibrionales bacterium]